MVKQCKTITISNCPSDDSCNGCVDIVKSQCIKYTGADLLFLGVNNGDTLSQILVKLDSIIETLSGS